MDKVMTADGWKTTDVVVINVFNTTRKVCAVIDSYDTTAPVVKSRTQEVLLDMSIEDAKELISLLSQAVAEVEA